MKIERDEVEFLAGVRGGETLGSPIAVVVRNRDYETPANRALMDPLTGGGEPLTNPRPGHADYAGALKYRQRDLRNVLERASARETAMRVALGAICAQFLAALGMTTRSLRASHRQPSTPARSTNGTRCGRGQRRALPRCRSRGEDDRARSTPQRPPAIRWAASSSCASTACRSASAAIASPKRASTASWRAR